MRLSFRLIRAVHSNSLKANYIGEEESHKIFILELVDKSIAKTDLGAYNTKKRYIECFQNYHSILKEMKSQYHN